MLFERVIYLVCIGEIENKVESRKWGGRGGDLTPLPCGFSKTVSSKDRVKYWFIVTFNIIINHIFPENLIEIPQVVQKI